MGVLENYLLVFLAGLITALATGIGALPFFVLEEISDRWNVALWGLASGIMLSASVFGLVSEGYAEADPWPWALALGFPEGSPGLPRSSPDSSRASCWSSSPTR